MLTRTRTTIITSTAAAAVGLAVSIAAPALATARPTPSAAAGPGGALGLTHHAIGPITAAASRSRTFAGYQAAVTAGSATTLAATFTVPALSCTTAERGITPDAGVATNKFKTASIAGVLIGCAGGKAIYFPFLVANGAESDYTTVHLSAGDVINLSASVTTSGITVQVTDVTKNVSVTNTITGAGASADAAWIGDDSAVSNTGALLGVPNFGKLTFTNCLIDGKALGGWHPQAYQRVNGRGTVEIATGRPWPGGAAFNTFYRNS